MEFTAIVLHAHDDYQSLCHVWYKYRDAVLTYASRASFGDLQQLLRQMQDVQQPALFRVDDRFFVKLDHKALLIHEPTCFSDCVEVLFKCILCLMCSMHQNCDLCIVCWKWCCRLVGAAFCLKFMRALQDECAH